MNRRITLAGQVREVAERLVEFTMKDLSIALKAQSYAENARIRSALNGLKKIGQVISLKPGLFRYSKKARPFSLVQKMWRAILVKQRFTRQDLVRLTGASKTHAHKFIMFCEAEHLISCVSDSRSYSGGVFQLIDPEYAPLEHPIMPDYEQQTKLRARHERKTTFR